MFCLSLIYKFDHLTGLWCIDERQVKALPPGREGIQKGRLNDLSGPKSLEENCPGHNGNVADPSFERIKAYDNGSPDGIFFSKLL